MRIEPEIGQCTIVLLGRFNPLIFVPNWFLKHDLLSAELVEAAKVGVLHADLSVLTFGKIRLQAEAQRLSFETSEAPWIDLCDLVARILTVIPSTPINQMGINRLVHFSVGTEERRNRIGQILAPLEPWGAWGEEIAASPPQARGGCVDLTMRLPKSGDGYKGHMQISVQPSAHIKGNVGIYALTNDHYDVGPIKETADCVAITKLLIENFERSIERSEQLIDQVMSLGEPT
jgi:hypothetical protein